MDYRKINSYIILLLIVFVVGLTTAMLGRLIVLDKGADTGTANLTFVIILGVCIIAYLIILATLAHIIIPCIIKKLPNKEQYAPTAIEHIVFNEKEKTPEQFAENIRQNYTRNYIEKQNEKINLFLKYSHLTVAPYITNDELLLLNECIRLSPKANYCQIKKFPIMNYRNLLNPGANVSVTLKLEDFLSRKEVEFLRKGK